MTNYLSADDAVAILKHYAIDVAEGHLRKGVSVVVTGGPTADAAAAITVSVGEHRANRLVPVTDFLAWGLVGELAEPLLKPESQLGRAVANLIVKLSHMYIDSHLASFALTVLIEGDHYEIVPKSLEFAPTHETRIPHRLDPHAHDKGSTHAGTTGFVNRGR
jgi:hypothetical protein